MKKKRIVPWQLEFDCLKFIRVMKISLVLLIVCGLSLSASVVSQDKHVDLSIKNATLLDVFEQIKKSTGYGFIFKDDQIDLSKTYSFDVKDGNINEVLMQLLDKDDYRYAIIENNVVITRIEKTATASSEIQQQLITITGKVSDKFGEPVPGVNVYEKNNAQHGVITGIDGTYTLQVDEPEDIIVFSFIGFVNQEIQIAGRSSIDVTLVEESIGLNEVVAIGYGSMKKSDLTGAVSSFELEKTVESPNVNIGQYLQGAVPGLNIGQVDEAGENPSISVRGQSTLSGNKNVLIVVDGIIFNGSLAELNPADINNVNVLKDASSKAIYGAQAANGVLLIETKKGARTEGKPVINYSTSFSTQTPTNELTPYNNAGWEEKNTRILWRDAYTESSGYLDPNPDYNHDESFAPYNLSTELAEYREAGVEFDWYDALTGPGKTVKHDLSVSGRTSNTTYMMSVGYTDQDGFLLNDDFNRVTGRINLESTITDWFTFGVNSYVAMSDYSGASISYPSRQTNHFPGYDDNGEIIPRWGVYVSPLASLIIPDFDKRNSIFGKIYAKVDIPQIKGLTYTINYGNNYRWSRHYNANEYVGSGEAYKNNGAAYDWTLDNILSYKTTLNEAHNIDVTLLYGARENKYESTKSKAVGFSSMLLGYNSLEQGENLFINSDAWEESFLYQMARMNYNYRNKYYITATYRRDGFSGFSKNNKIGEFPSVALSWSIGEEGFMDQFAFVEQLKLRAGYGESGNLTSRNSSLGLVNSGPAYVLGASSLIGQYPSSLANNNLLWEKTLEYNYGLDFSILRGLVSGSFDYYSGKTNDLLFNVSVPSVTGFTTIKSNLGEIANRGFEAMINVRPVKRQDFSWEIGLVFSTNKNEVVELPGTDNNGNGKVDINTGSRNQNFLEEGLSIGSIQNFGWNGFWQISDFNEGTITNAQIGSERVIDQDGVDGIDQEDLIIVGKTEPAYRFSIQNTLKYKQFGLSFLVNSIQGGKDGYLGNNTVNYLSMGHALSENMYQQVNFWTPSNPNADWRSPSSTQFVSGFSQWNSRSFVRLQDVSLTYDVSSNIIDRIGLGSLRLFVSGKNLLTFTDWKGWDPETGAGLNGGRPVMKSFTLGLDVSF